VIVLLVPLSYALWSPGEVVKDGRHDRGSNGIWLQHGWLGDDGWFHRNAREDRKPHFRDQENIKRLAAKLREHRIRDVYPHLCPCSPNGEIAAIDHQQTGRFLEEFQGFRVLPWVGGVFGEHASPEDQRWRSNFVNSIAKLLERHPWFAGVHVNIEPMPSGNEAFLSLLEELKAALPEGKLLSVAAYPPPTRWHPFPDVHWDEAYFRAVARRTDQLAVMMYDTSLKYPKLYQRLMADWTEEVLNWSEGKAALLGVPTYDDADVEYHDPKVENLPSALLGIHAGLSRYETLPPHYQGVALYCEWETDEIEWTLFREQFLRRPMQ
jgi:hypothetical protein